MEQHSRDSSQVSTKQQSVGATIAIVVVLAMVIIGAFYAWGKHSRTKQNTLQQTQTTSTTTIK